MSKACLLEGEYRRARGLCGIEGAGCNAGQYEKVMWTISLRRLKRAPEHFVLFEGKISHGRYGTVNGLLCFNVRI